MIMGARENIGYIQVELTALFKNSLKGLSHEI